MTSAQRALADDVLTTRLSETVIQDRRSEIHQAVLTQSHYLRQANFAAIHSRDLEFLFRAYDERWFAGLIRPALEGKRLRFRLSTRMTSAGGKTTRFRSSNGDVSYEIAIACSLLFNGFRDADRGISVCGIECENRLQALQRIFEHELIHLIEQVCWESSECAAARFQDIAARHFLHQANTHQLVTWRERAVKHGIRPGTIVSFVFEGRRLSGRRITLVW